MAEEQTPAEKAAEALEREFTEFFGPRCPDHDPDCLTCEAWGLYDRLLAALRSPADAQTPVGVEAGRIISDGFPRDWYVQDRPGDKEALLCRKSDFSFGWGGVCICVKPRLISTEEWLSVARWLAHGAAAEGRAEAAEKERDEALNSARMAVQQFRYISKANADNFSRAEAAEKEAAALREALLDAQRIARNGCLVPPDGGEPTEGEREMCDHSADLIAARTQGE